jgi:hypothetical protein
MILLVLLSLPASGILLAEEAIQTDWSGGGGTSGPVLEWADRFDSAAGLSFSAIPGQLALSSTALASPVEQLVDSSHVGAIGVGVGDVDNDGDLDIVGTAQTSGMVLLWENDGADPPGFTEHTVATPPGAAGIDVADIDADGRLDMVISMVDPRNKIVWKQNQGGDPIVWGNQVIQNPWRDAWEISTGDVDGDGNLDVMCTCWSTADVTWWRNDGNDPIAWTPHLVDGSLMGAHSVRGADLDGDGDMDLAAAAGLGHKIVVYWSDGADSITWTRQEVETGFTGARSVWIDDIDRDGDLDIAGICWTSDLAWWSNDGGDPVVWTRQTITVSADGGHALCIADLNGDDRPDILTATNGNNRITWWENGGGSPIVWTERVVSDTFEGSISVRAGDVDGDGDLDPVGVCWGGDQFSWWEATEFDSSGELTSSILDAGTGTSAGTIDWNAVEPAGTGIVFQVRSSDDPGNLGSWSNDITGPGSLPGPTGRYLQYRALLETSDTDVSAILKDVTLDLTQAGIIDQSVLSTIRLSAHPNPFRPQLTVSLSLPAREQVRLGVFDVMGREVHSIVAGSLEPGDHRWSWDGYGRDGSLLAPGVYWLCLEAGGTHRSRELVLLR